jgi:hypothetical protein
MRGVRTQLSQNSAHSSSFLSMGPDQCLDRRLASGFIPENLDDTGLSSACVQAVKSRVKLLVDHPPRFLAPSLLRKLAVAAVYPILRPSRSVRDGTRSVYWYLPTAPCVKCIALLLHMASFQRVATGYGMPWPVWVSASLRRGFERRWAMWL